MKRMIAVLMLWTLFCWLWLMMEIWIPVAVLAGLHIIEIFVIGLKTGKENDFTPLHSAFLTFMFGVTWWGPMRRKKK